MSFNGVQTYIVLESSWLENVTASHEMHLNLGRNPKCP